MNSLEGIIAANRAAEKNQALARATNGAYNSGDAALLKPGARKAPAKSLPKRDASGRLAR